MSSTKNIYFSKLNRIKILTVFTQLKQLRKESLKKIRLKRDSSVGRALHRHRRGHRFDYRSSLNFSSFLFATAYVAYYLRGSFFYLIFHPLFKIYVSYNHIQKILLLITHVIFFSVRERAVFYKSCDLIGSGSGRYSPIRPAHSGRYPMRDESSITSLTSLQFFINYKLSCKPLTFLWQVLFDVVDSDDIQATR